MTDNMTVRSFAALHDVDERTVQRWLKAGKLPGAVKTNKGWVIPADAAAPGPDGAPMARGAAPGAAVAVPGGQLMPALPPGGLSALVDALPAAFIPLELAVMLLGIPEAAIRRNAEDLGAKPWGPRGTLVVPVRTVRENAGL